MSNTEADSMIDSGNIMSALGMSITVGGNLIELMDIILTMGVSSTVGDSMIDFWGYHGYSGGCLVQWEYHEYSWRI